MRALSILNGDIVEAMRANPLLDGSKAETDDTRLGGGEADGVRLRVERDEVMRWELIDGDLDAVAEEGMEER
jgi:hypothetical protein